MALWRTSLAVVAFALSGCGGQTTEQHGGSSQTLPPPQAGQAKLVPVGQQPFTVEGTGFRPGEHVRVTTDAKRPETVDTIADERGAFRVVFHHHPCGSITVKATGSKGSSAEFNLSQIVCLDQ